MDVDIDKILIVAPNASSKFGGEAFLPLKYFQILRRRGKSAILIAHARNHDDLVEALGPMVAHVHFVQDTPWHHAIWWVGKFFPAAIRDTIFRAGLDLINELSQRTIIKNLVIHGDVQIIHQPIPVSPLIPSTMYGFGVPVVIGPMNGGMTYPVGYEEFESYSVRRLLSAARSLAHALNFLIHGKRDAATLIVANHRTRNSLPFPDHPNIVMLPENGVDFETWRRPPMGEVRTRGDEFRLVFMGRLVRWKAVDITLHALSIVRTRGVNARLDILGDGAERRRLEALVATLHLGEAVKFHGFVDQGYCSSQLRLSDALILNSVWECGGAVVLEAMAMGLPVIGPDWGGPADYLDTDCGILVSPVPRDTFKDRLADAIQTLALDPQLRVRLGTAGANKSRLQYDWERKVDKMLEIYGAAVATDAERLS